MRKPFVFKSISAVLASTVLSIGVWAQDANGSSDAVTHDSSKAFQVVDSHKGNFVRIDSEVDWSHYRNYHFSPSAYQPSSTRHSLKPRQVEQIEATVDTSLQRAFRHRGEESGAVLDVRPVITDVRKVIPVINVLSFLAVQAPVSFGGLSVRYELFDAASGSRVGEIESKRSARPWNVYPWDIFQNFRELGHSSLIAKRDAHAVLKDVNRLVNKPSKTAPPVVAGIR